jgi:hypothetical protein
MLVPFDKNTYNADKDGRLRNSYQLNRCGKRLVILFSLPLILVQRLAHLRRIHTDHNIPITLVSYGRNLR